MSKPWLAWRMAVLATHLCLDMGWHNNPQVLEDSEATNTRSLLFWHLYALERGLSLRLGRPSSFRDNIITISRSWCNLPFPATWTKMFSFWVGTASIQGKLYEDLYSTPALAQSEETISSRIEVLMSEWQSLGTSCSYVRVPYHRSRFYPISFMAF